MTTETLPFEGSFDLFRTRIKSARSRMEISTILLMLEGARTFLSRREDVPVNRAILALKEEAIQHEAKLQAMGRLKQSVEAEHFANLLDKAHEPGAIYSLRQQIKGALIVTRNVETEAELKRIAELCDAKYKQAQI